MVRAISVVLAALVVWAGTVVVCPVNAGNFYVPAHLVRLGTCEDGEDCRWSCDDTLPFCSDGSSCELDAADARSGVLVLRADDTGCAAGSTLEVGIRTFVGGGPGSSTIPSGTLDLCTESGGTPSLPPDLECDCNQDVTGLDACVCPALPCDEDACSQPNCPGDFFLCNPDDPAVDELDLPEVSNWFGSGLQVFPPYLRSVVFSPSTTGTAVVYHAGNSTLDDHSSDGAKSVAKYCIRVLRTYEDRPVCTPELPLPTSSDLTVDAADLDDPDCNPIACGDGIRDPGEECDDGCLAGMANVCEPADDGDGCDSLCLAEECYECSGNFGGPSTCSPAPNGTPCDDGEACTGGDACTAAACVPGTPVATCTGGDGCCPGACNAGNDSDCVAALPLLSPLMLLLAALVLAALLLRLSPARLVRRRP